ncbi:hypothetical protein CH299_27840 [Rhodococcus sp. 14-2686-1-2]|nr:MULTISPECIES: enoyl-CoA hydratase/isomerase family protein [unclassified Rhodococcus (in: high G+C Gram-positive bacteria)]OZE93165.1 hypothetical protein CH301_27320 [Rhodococcus sp. 15-1189-1-1a]OZF08283.1 hypothetical protein CH299_27840 [Rhodococcus sp. 14-2686-1-2]
MRIEPDGVQPGELLQSWPAPGVLLLTMSRPHVHNAITLAMQRRIDSAMADAAVDVDTRAVVLAGADGSSFCSGYDIDEMSQICPDALAGVLEERNRMLWRFCTAAIPVVAAVHGHSMGAGTLLASCADFRVGGPAASLAVTAVDYGGAHLTWVLADLIGGAYARDLLMTGRRVEGEEAFGMGLLSRYVPDGDVLGASIELAVTLAAKPVDAIAAIKSLTLYGAGAVRREKFDRECDVNRTDLVDAASRLFERAKPQSSGAPS